MSFEYLLTTLIVVLIPGTGVIYTLSTGLMQGARASIWAALGCTMGIVPALLASVLGLAAIMHSSALVFQVVKFIGVAYLLYLAWGMWQQTGGLKFSEKIRVMSGMNTAFKGFLINIFNPKLSLFFLAFLPQFIPAHAAAPLIDFAILSAIFMGVTFVVFVIYGLFAHSMRHYILSSDKIMRIVQRSFAVVFAGLAAKLAFSER
ncbi:MAG: LysE family translocator [Alphaproteobacteria bacterium]|nr:LysE family translocator [Alphaproteobacteria bacterium]